MTRCRWCWRLATHVDMDAGWWCDRHASSLRLVRGEVVFIPIVECAGAGWRRFINDLLDTLAGAP